MAKVISTLFISADGVAEIDPDWHFPYFDENMGRAVGEDYDTADVLLIGRETYGSFAGAWPGWLQSRSIVTCAPERSFKPSAWIPAKSICPVTIGGRDSKTLSIWMPRLASQCKNCAS